MKNLLILFVLLLSFKVPAQNLRPLGIGMESFDYPYEVKYINFNIEGNDVRMAYMEVNPASSNGKVVTLFHGKNFFGEYWHSTIRFLADKGFRVIVPDQIGFGKSSKPNVYYTFHMLAQNTKALLDSIGIEKTAVIGHSMGGMVASRFTLMFPDVVTKLILENPIGLEDYKVKVPYTPTEQLYKSEFKKTEQGIRDYHKKYYVNWKDEYDKYVMVHYRWTLSSEFPRLAWVNALTTQMVYSQPVIYEFSSIKVPSLLVIGQSDRTAIGKDKVSDEVAATLGQYPELGKKAAEAIPNAQLVELENVGHIPHFEAADRFHEEILKFLNSD